MNTQGIGAPVVENHASVAAESRPKDAAQLAEASIAEDAAEEGCRPIAALSFNPPHVGRTMTYEQPVTVDGGVSIHAHLGRTTRRSCPGERGHVAQKARGAAFVRASFPGRAALHAALRAGPPPETPDLNKLPGWRFQMRFEQPETGRVAIYERDEYTIRFVY